MNDSPETVREISSVEEFESTALLDNVVYYEVSGRRFDGFDDRTAPDHDVNGHVRLNVMQMLEGSALAVRSRAEVVTGEGRFVADVAVFFRAPEAFRVSDHVAFEIANKVAVPIVRPYLREAIHQSAVKLGVTPPLLALLDKSGAEITPSS